MALQALRCRRGSPSEMDVVVYMLVVLQLNVVLILCMWGFPPKMFLENLKGKWGLLINVIANFSVRSVGVKKIFHKKLHPFSCRVNNVSGLCLAE